MDSAFPGEISQNFLICRKLFTQHSWVSPIYRRLHVLKLLFVFLSIKVSFITKGGGGEKEVGPFQPLGPGAVSPPTNRMSKYGKAHTKLPLLMDRTPRDGHINKAHKKCTNIKSYKH